MSFLFEFQGAKAPTSASIIDTQSSRDAGVMWQADSTRPQGRPNSQGVKASDSASVGEPPPQTRPAPAPSLFQTNNLRGRLGGPEKGGCSAGGSIAGAQGAGPQQNFSEPTAKLLRSRAQNFSEPTTNFSEVGRNTSGSINFQGAVFSEPHTESSENYVYVI